MFKIMALFEGKNRICEFRKAFDGLSVPECSFTIYDTYEIDKDEEVFTSCKKEMQEADLVMFLFHGSMANFKRYVTLREYFEGKKPYFFYSTIDSEMEEMNKKCQIPCSDFRALLSYLEAGGETNTENFLKYLLNKTAGYCLDYQEVVHPVRSGIYKKNPVENPDDYLRLLKKSPKPIIGILFHLYSIQHEDTDFVDGLIETIQKYDCIALPVYSSMAPSVDEKYGGLREDLQKYMMLDGESVPDSVIVITGHSLSILSSPGCGMQKIGDSVFELLKVPVLHGLTTNFSYEQWKASINGMDPVYLGNVYTGEYDGQLITVVFASTEEIKTPYGTKEKYVLIPERAGKIVRLAKNWAKLSKIPNQEKKIAIIFHNMPPRMDMIGAAFGLDTPESVYRMFLRLKEEGLYTEYDYTSGKEIGLSENCFPDAAILDLPNLYPYIINVPGEGAQAKRRTAACIIDHLIPAMTEGGAYGDLAVLDDLAEDYYKARLNDKMKCPLLRDEICTLTKKLKLMEELEISEEDFEKDFDKTLEKIHLWISEIKASEIKEGLHIFGQAPEKERMQDMLRLLVRVKNKNVPSLRQSIAAMQGLDADELMSCPQKVSGEKTNTMRLELIDEIGRELFGVWADTKYDVSLIQTIISKLAEKYQLDMTKSGELEKCMHYVSEVIYPSLLQTTDEIDSLLEGLSGKFVKKGPSGSPSRGNAHILPTGRNFYTIDPNEVPTRAFWETGKKLAEQLMEEYKKENEGVLPESIAIVVYAGDTMKTNGDDISEVLFLYGIRPVWLGESDRVIGLEVIPLEELKRPRIDVTLRITGLFCDTFPNLIELVDEAVNLAAAQEETFEDNFIRKHINQDVEEFMQQGMEREQAYERAAVRIFGCPPGTYGAGVDIMINSKNWETDKNLGDAYMTWSGHAYSKKLHGEENKTLLAHRLKSCDATVKNIFSCETDMLDDDDFYNYHGGLISAVKAVKGEKPSSYSTDVSDLSRISTKNIHKDAARILRARVNNPKWIEGLKQHGFKGAQEFAIMTDIVFGWDATSGIIDDYMYDDIYETYIHNEDLRKWIEQENPYALHAMSERLLEAIQRGMWAASEDKKELLQKLYLNLEGTMEEN